MLNLNEKEWKFPEVHLQSGAYTNHFQEFLHVVSGFNSLCAYFSQLENFW